MSTATWKISIGLVVGVVSFVGLALWSQANVGWLQTIVTQSGVWGVISYITVLALSIVVAPISTGFLLPVAATSFGPNLAAAYSIVGWTLGSTVSFIIARGAVQLITPTSPLIKKIIAYERSLPPALFYGLVIGLRMIVPVDVLSYALGAFSTIRIKAFILTTLVGVTPLTFIFAHTSLAPLRVQLYILASVLILVGLSWYYILHHRNDQNKNS